MVSTKSSIPTPQEETASSDRRMMEYSLDSLQKAYNALRALSLEEAIRDVSGCFLYRGKPAGDTKMLDNVPEDKIIFGHEGGLTSPFRLCYRKEGVVLSEERGRSNPGEIDKSTPVIVSDPLDGSSRLRGQLAENLGRFNNVGEIFDFYKERLGDLARIEAPVSSLALIQGGKIKYSLVINHITGHIYAACREGVFGGQHSEDLKLTDLVNESNRIEWRDGADGSDGGSRTKPTILCNRNGKARTENFTSSHLADLVEHYLPADYFAGPSRFTYLLKGNEGLFPGLDMVGYNREPISEWMSSLCFAQYSGGALQAFLMSQDMQNGLFRGRLGEGVEAACLNRITYPSEYRETLVIAPSANEAATREMEAAVKNGYAIQLV